MDAPADGCGAHIMQDDDDDGGAAVTLDVCPRIIFFIYRYNIHRGRGVITRGIIIILCVHTPWAYTHTPDFLFFIYRNGF